MLSLVQTVAPPVEPITLVQATNHLRVDAPEDFPNIQSYISSARDYIERYISKAIIQQQWTLGLNAFPFAQFNSYSMSSRRYVEDFYINKAMAIFIPRPPLVSVQSITYVDGSGAPQTLDPTSYVVDGSVEPGQIVPSTGVFWPYPQAFTPNTVKINFTAGYPNVTITENDNVPALSPYSFALANQNIFGITSVSYSTGGALTLVNGAPAPGQYSYSAGTITVNSADKGKTLVVVYQTYQIPPAITQAMLLLVTKMYLQRTPEIKDNANLDNAIHSLLAKVDSGIIGYNHD
ncbi:MAG TPA: phage head-tail connector protein [Acidobacteriaceae bacterium]|nr:phage head-tail connector protein [Acidobacteriaceae bacterium]